MRGLGRSWNLLVLGAAAAAICLLSLWMCGTRSDVGPTSGLASGDQPRVEFARPAADSHSPVSDDQGATREEAATSTPVFHVLDAAGSPIPRALLSWCPTVGLAGSGFGPEELERVTSWTTSNERGEARFESDAPVPAVVWATHADYFAAFEIIESAPAPGPCTLTLDPRRDPGTWIHVIDARDGSVEGATVLQVGLQLADRRALDASGPPPMEVEHRQALACFLRRHVTDSQGQTRTSAVGMDCVLQARKGDLRSRPKLQLTGDEEVVLRLGEIFVALGRVHVPPELEVDTRLEVLHSAQVSDKRIPIGRSEVRPDGSWGPIELPIAGSPERVIFRMRGGDCIPVEEERPAPSARETLVIDFYPKVGVAVDVQVVESSPGSAQDAISDAKVSVFWREEPHWRSSLEWTGKDGLARVRGCPPTTVWVRAQAEGHVERTRDSVGLPRREPVRIALDRAGVIRGTCLHDGKPVHDFKVMTWQDNVQQRSVQEFTDRADGSFEFTSAPLGETAVLASSAEYPESAATFVTVFPGEVAEVTLALRDPVMGRGRVVDALTGKPIPSARIQVYACYSLEFVTTRGSELAVTSDGTFELRRFAASDTRIAVHAEGYSSDYPTGNYDQAGAVDFGVIALSRRQALEVRLVSKTPTDWSHLRFRAQCAAPIPYTGFPSSGVLRIEDAVAGKYFWDVVWPSGNIVSGQVWFVPGRNWILEVPLESAGPVTIEVMPEPGEDIPAGAAAAVIYLDERGRSLQQVLGLPEGGVLQVDHVQGDDVSVTVFQQNTQFVYGVARARFDGNAERRVVVPLHSSELEVRVVDGAGEPLPDAYLVIASDEAESCWFTSAWGDARGSARFRGLSFERVVLSAYHPTAGVRANVVVDLAPTGRTEAEIVLDAKQDLTLLLADGGEPIAGAWVRLLSTRSTMPIDDRTSGADGRATWTRAAAGDYRVQVDHAGSWPVDRLVHFDGSATPVPIQVRRLGAVSVKVLDADGFAASGVTVDLRSHELDESVASWIERGLVPGGPLALVTDATGTIAVDGIPNGDYTCRVLAADGTPVAKPVTVPPRASASVELRLP